MTDLIACPRCNAGNPRSARFCSLCSAPLTAGPLSTAPSPNPVVQRDPSEVFVLCLAIFGLCGCGPITAIPALIMARRQRAANPHAQLPLASYWISIITLGFTALTVAAMILIIGFGAATN